MVWTFAVPAIQLALLFLVTLLNRGVADRFVRYRRFEWWALIALWYLVLLGGALLGGVSAAS